MIDRVLPNTRTIVLDSRANGSGVVPLLPLGQFFPESKAAPPSGGSGAEAPAATGGR
jgi:hypothetical protein